MTLLRYPLAVACAFLFASKGALSQLTTPTRPTASTTTTTTGARPTRPAPPLRNKALFKKGPPEKVVGIIAAVPKGGVRGGGAGAPNDFESGNGGGGGVNGALCVFDQQDCPDGYKCTVEDIWLDKPRCRSLQDNDDQVGDLCSELGNNDGDSCDVDGLCLGGTCRQLDTDNTLCPLKDVSHTYPSGVRLCEEVCDPLSPSSCPSDAHCTRTSSSPDGIFSCHITNNINLAGFGESCVSDYQCQQGAICLQSDAVPFGFCDNGLPKCCVPLCELGKLFCQGGSTCQSIYNNNVPPGFESVGACVL